MNYFPLIAIGLVCYLLGRYTDTVTEFLGNDLPSTDTLGINAVASPTLPPWAVAGDYLVRDNGVWSNRTLTSHARYLMGEHPTHVLYLQPAKEVIRVSAMTPSGGKYTRIGYVRTARVSGLELQPC